VLLALGLSQAQALSSLRVSLGRYSTQADVDRAIAVINDALQAPAPFW
jgi:cysteine desulfurase